MSGKLGKGQVWNSAWVVLTTSRDMGELTRFSRKSDGISFSSCENSASIPLESHEISECGSRSFSTGSYIWVLWMKKDNYRKWTVKIEIKLQHHQLVMFKILRSLSDMVNSWWKRAPFEQIFSRNHLRLGLRPRPRWRSLRYPDLLYCRLCLAPLMPRFDSNRHFSLLPHMRKKFKKVKRRLYTKK